MPRQTDNAEPTNTLPPPELNPLINPVLGQNMGRWAEVYFNNPPERREKAVLALLHELEAETLHHEASPHHEVPPPEEFATRAFTPERAFAPEDGPPQFAEAEMVVCESCGRQNPPLHKFCGMCGMLLENFPLAEEIAPESFHVKDLREHELLWPPPNPEPDISPSPPAVDARTSTDGFPLFPRKNEIRLTDDNLGDSPIATRSSPSYRLYIGAALALLAVALVYIAWRGAQVTGADATSETSKAPDGPTPTAAVSAPTTSSPEPTTASHQIPQPVSHKVLEEDLPKKPAAAVPLATASPADTTQKQPAPEAGAADLAMAESYLNGTNGQQRNTDEAVQWLWKAVSKRNAAATLELSDLYLKGNGVPKNCDQARILLDAAARKGMKEAGERLRNLQAFGCE